MSFIFAIAELKAPSFNVNIVILLTILWNEDLMPQLA